MTPLLPLVLGPEAALLKPTRALAPVLFALVERNRQRLARWLPWVDHVRTVADEARFLEECRRAFKRGERLPGVLAVGGAVVGMVTLTLDRAGASGEIGYPYWIDRDAEGRGHVSSAAARLCALGFEELQLERIVIRTAVDNVRSRSVPRPRSRRSRLCVLADGVAGTGVFDRGVRAPATRGRMVPHAPSGAESRLGSLGPAHQRGRSRSVRGSFRLPSGEEGCAEQALGLGPPERRLGTLAERLAYRRQEEGRVAHVERVDDVAAHGGGALEPRVALGCEPVGEAGELRPVPS